MTVTAEQNGSSHMTATHAASLLLVDDDPEIREEMKSYLSANGMVVTEACDAQSALKAFSEGQFDLIGELIEPTSVRPLGRCRHDDRRYQAAETAGVSRS